MPFEKFDKSKNPDGWPTSKEYQQWQGDRRFYRLWGCKFSEIEPDYANKTWPKTTYEFRARMLRRLALQAEIPWIDPGDYGKREWLAVSPKIWLWAVGQIERRVGDQPKTQVEAMTLLAEKNGTGFMVKAKREVPIPKWCLWLRRWREVSLS